MQFVLVPSNEQAPHSTLLWPTPPVPPSPVSVTFWLLLVYVAVTAAAEACEQKMPRERKTIAMVFIVWTGGCLMEWYSVNIAVISSQRGSTAVRQAQVEICSSPNCLT